MERGGRVMNNDKSIRMEALLRNAGFGPYDVACYGSQVTVEFLSRESAERCASLLSNAFKIRSVLKSQVDAKENKGTCLLPTKRTVWRVYACAKQAGGTP